MAGPCEALLLATGQSYSAGLSWRPGAAVPVTVRLGLTLVWVGHGLAVNLIPAIQDQTGGDRGSRGRAGRWGRLADRSGSTPSLSDE